MPEIKVHASALFQFHNGSIKSQTIIAAFELGRRSFNSTMVRLKVAIGQSNSSEHVSFNSTMVRLKVQLSLTQGRIYQFQFHNGSIKRGCYKSLVRLPFSVFQFHNGSIKSNQTINNPSTPQPFQFHNGSIKRHSKEVREMMSESVSIPQWFD